MKIESPNLNGLAKFIALSVLFAWPLGIWKLIEIIVWIFSHVRIEL